MDHVGDIRYSRIVVNNQIALVMEWEEIPTDRGSRYDLDWGWCLCLLPASIANSKKGQLTWQERQTQVDNNIDWRYVCMCEGVTSNSQDMVATYHRNQLKYSMVSPTQLAFLPPIHHAFSQCISFHHHHFLFAPLLGRVVFSTLSFVRSFITILS